MPRLSYRELQESHAALRELYFRLVRDAGLVAARHGRLVVENAALRLRVRRLERGGLGRVPARSAPRTRPRKARSQ
jgi:hypothetical protein